VLLADDHVMVRQGLRALLEAEPDLAVVGEAGEGREALRLVGLLRPDVLVVDVDLPGLSALEVMREMRRQRLTTRVVALSSDRDETPVLLALREGALAYVLRGSPAQTLIEAVRFAAAGRRFLSPPLRLDEMEARLSRMPGGAADPYESLTPREREVLELAAEGLSNADIARRLGISRRTVEGHIASAGRKLGLRGRVQMVRYALGRTKPPG
jgi:DNA-binding NarL/FixJ family response regulator